MKTRILVSVSLLIFSIAVVDTESAWADDPFAAQENIDDFAAELEFFKVESDVVTSVSRKPESLWGAAAAVYVVTSEDIRKSGARSIPEALRMVPGLDVAAIDHNEYAISARGFNNAFADKMLVLLDGRPIYTPEFGGTIWNQWNTFLPDIDRIEIIRGPGGTLWGSNAVNGVINIITKSSEDTHGAMLRTSVGDNSQYSVAARWGGEIGHFNYRGYALQSSTDGYGEEGGDAVFDENDETRAGYHFDWDLGEGLTFSGSGEVYNGRHGSMNYLPLSLDPVIGVPVDGPAKFKTDLYTGIVKIAKDFASGSHVYFQVAATYADRAIPFLSFGPDTLSTRRTSSDIEFGHNFRVSDRHLVTWGMNYHRTKMEINGSAILSFTFPENDDKILDLASLFVQDQIELWQGGELTFGAKAEWNTFTQWNVQPSIRLAHRFNDDTTVWGSISRAVNIPSFGDNFVTITSSPDTTSMPGLTIIPTFEGDESIDDTELLAYEVGVRHRINHTANLDVSAFYNDYDNFASFSGSTFATVPDPLDPTRITAITTMDNVHGAYGYGAEAILEVTVNDRVRAELNGSWQTIEQLGNRNPQVPEFKLNFRPEFDLTDTLQFIPTVHWVDDVITPLPLAPTTGSTMVDSYVRLDMALHWAPREDLPTFSFVWQNATEEDHLEAHDVLVRPTPVAVTRSWYIRATYEF
jgi:iron complex outermembrane receptor protein